MTAMALSPSFVHIARPHPFIVHEMRMVLERGGWTPVLSEQLSNVPPRAIEAAVISMAIVSAVPEPYLDVFRAVRAQSPTRPVVFATLMSLELGQRALERELLKLERPPRVLTLTSMPRAIEPTDVLLVTKADIESAQSNRFLAVMQQFVRARAQ